MNKRIDWIDVAKFFGIYAIYLGHFGTAAGNAYGFVFSYHVPLFFFISGAVESLNTQERIGQYILKKTKSLLLPFYLFVFLSAFFGGFQDALWKAVLKGAVRNQFYAGSLWFLTCLFAVEVIFALLRKLKHAPLILTASVLMYYFAVVYWKPPRAFYNIDSALNYLIYFVIGYYTFPAIRKMFELKTNAAKFAFVITGALAFAYSFCVFKSHDPLNRLYAIPVAGRFFYVLRALIIIWLMLVMARILHGVPMFGELGRNTLYLCGSEYIIKILVPCAASIIGLQVDIQNLMQACIYTAVLLLLANRYMVPLEQRLLSFMTGLSSKA